MLVTVATYPTVLLTLEISPSLYNSHCCLSVPSVNEFHCLLSRLTSTFTVAKYTRFPLKDNLTFPACLFSCRSMSRLGSGASFATHSVFISPSLITGTACVPQRIRASFAKSISCRTTLENLQGVSPRFIGFCSLAYPL